MDNDAFNTALDAFMDSVNADTKEYSKRFDNLEWSDDPESDAHFKPLFIAGGRKFVKLAYKSGCQTMVYCFVEVETGRVLKAETWKKPSKLDRGVNIFDASTYSDKVKHPGSAWLYA